MLVYEVVINALPDVWDIVVPGFWEVFAVKLNPSLVEEKTQAVVWPNSPQGFFAF